jgi:hypothetical protein
MKIQIPKERRIYWSRANTILLRIILVCGINYVDGVEWIKMAQDKV